MRSIQPTIAAVLLLWSLSACMTWTEKELARPVTSTPQPTMHSLAEVEQSLAQVDPSITANIDVAQLLDYLRQRGVSLGDPHESRAAFLYPVRGVAYEFDGGLLFIHPFPNAQAAEQRANQMPPEMTPSVIDWVDKPHFYRCKSTIVLYLGTNAQITQALTEFCGSEFAGS